MYKKIIWSIIGVVLAVGLFFYVRYEMKVYNTLIMEHQRISVIDNFITETFKDQVQAYVNAKKQAPLPANAPVAPKK